ncbi:hypothetical protein DPMN_138811 [Dreissena polymorpha]|uniref:Uncharacterized protein n=1 Tax=Dreissena polymorpha TaxID=45954 RepID=A0A9D4G7D1_DREPO|nr:hypothetical protein DPMN_138811 [Dreissena polymorpha]
MRIIGSCIVVFTTSIEEDKKGEHLRAALLIQRVTSSLEQDVLSNAKFAVSEISKIGVTQEER